MYDLDAIEWTDDAWTRQQARYEATEPQPCRECGTPEHMERSTRTVELQSKGGDKTPTPWWRCSKCGLWGHAVISSPAYDHWWYERYRA